MSSFSRSTLAASISVVLACSICSIAAAAPGETSPTTLDAVIVTTAAPVSPLTFETDPKLPRQPVPASDGADYLKTIPGFTALRNGGTNGDPVLRGMFGSRLNLLTNDGSMPGACPGRMDNPLSYVSPETYDRLIVVKGPQTVLWGPGASAGTVRFEREAPSFDEPGAQVSGSLLAGSFGRNDQMLDAAFGSPRAYARVSANRSEADDYEDGDGNTVPSAWEKWNADVAFGWTPDADTLVELTAGAGDGEARYAGRAMDGTQFRRDSYGLRFERRNFEGALDAVEGNVYYNYADHVMDNYTLRDPNPMSSMPMPMASNVDRRTTGGRMVASWAWQQWQLTAGLDTQESRHRWRRGHGIGGYLAKPWTTDGTLRNTGVFSEATWSADAGQRWVAGARIDRAQVDDERIVLGTKVTVPNPTIGMTRKETLPSGFVRFEQDLASVPVSWYAGVGHTRRMPDYWELFSANQGPDGSASAFDGVEPERTTQFDAGAQYRTPKLDAWVSAYAGRIDDFILFTYMPGGMTGTVSSVSNVDASIRGAEAGVEYRVAEHWKLGGTLAYARGSNRDAHTALAQMPPLEARLTAGFDNQRWNAGVLFRAVAEQDRVAPGQGNVTGRDFGPSAGFATLALNGGVRFNDRIQLTAGVDNVFDRTYSEHLNLAGSADFGYPADPVRINEPGRNAWLKVNLRY